MCTVLLSIFGGEAIGLNPERFHVEQTQMLIKATKEAYDAQVCMVDGQTKVRTTRYR